MLAVHGAAGTLQGNTTASSLTSLGYSGEHFDTKAQQQYFRARFYDPTNGRFNRLDPFAGNMQDPQSLHKYAYVHGDPVQGVDPTGMFLGAAGLTGAIGIGATLHVSTLMQGSLTILTLNTIGHAGMQIRNLGVAMIAAGDIDAGFALYDLGGAIFGLATDIVEAGTTGVELLSVGVAVVGIVRGAVQFASKGGLQKIGIALRNLQSIGKGASEASSFMSTIGPKFLGRDPLSPAGIEVFRQVVEAKASTRGGKPMKITFKVVQPGDPALIENTATGPVVGRARYIATLEHGVETGQMYVRTDATLYDVMHEVHYAQHHQDIGALYRTATTKGMREWTVYERLRYSPLFGKLTELEKDNALLNRDAYGFDPTPPHLQ